MSLLDFNKHFSCESVCIEKFKEMRIKSGLYIPIAEEHVQLPSFVHFKSYTTCFSGTIIIIMLNNSLLLIF